MAKTKSRESYINAPSRLETELKTLFNQSDPLVIFDIGSCEGEDSIRYSRLFPNAHIYAAEPLPKNLERMKASLAKYGVKNVEILPVALSSQKGRTTFYVSSGQREGYEPDVDWDFGNKSSSLLPPDETMRDIYPWLKFNETIEVETDTLQNICAARAITHIDFIHMDVQGAEYQVLTGAGELLRSTTLLWLEVAKQSMYKDQALKTQIEQFMAQNGFLKLKENVDDLTGDQLYFNKRYFNNPYPAHRVIYLLMRAKARGIARRAILFRNELRSKRTAAKGESA
jgi:FkbM family methyltransferase